MYVRAYKPLLGWVIHGAMVLFLSSRDMTIHVYCTSYSIYMNLESDIQHATNCTIYQLTPVHPCCAIYVHYVTHI